MDVKLEALIEKIKTEGVEEGERTAGGIIENARKEAAQLVARAKEESEQLRKGAEKDAAQFRAGAEAALQQASRDLVLKVREQLAGLCDMVFKRQIDNALSPEGLTDMLRGLAEKWAPEKGAAVEIMLNKDDFSRVEGLLLSGVKEELRNKVELKVASSIDHGFLIGKKGEDLYYDFTDESIIEALKVYVNPVLAGIIEKK